jgi:PAS domain S-box-containing protein
MEKKYLRKDGSSIWVRNSISLVPGTERVPRFIMALSEDITVRKRAEEALQRSEAYLAEGQRLAKTGSWAVNPNTERPIYWSEEMRQIFGLDPQRSSLPDREEFLRLVHPEDRAGLKERVDQTLRAKADIAVDFRIVLPDGTIKHIHGIGHPVLDETGNIIEYVGTDMDVTERKQAEEALRRSEGYLAGAERLSHTGSWAVQVPSGAVQIPELKMVHWSEEMYRIFCIDPGPMPPSHIERAQRLHPEDVARHHAIVSQAILDRTDFDTDYRLLLPNGTTKYIHAVGHPVVNASGDVVELVGTAMDVTERKQAEEALRRSERDLLEAQRISHTGSWKHDVSSGTVTVSPEVVRIFGVKPDEDTSTPEFWLSRNHPEDRKRIQELFERCEIEKTDYDADYRIVLPDGAIKHLHAVGRPILNQSGELLEFIGTVVDITERKQSEEALRRSEAYLAEAQKLTHTGSWAWNVRTDALFWSQEIFRIYDCNPEMTPTWDFLLERVHPEDRSNLERRKQMESTQKEWADSEIDFRIVRPDGTIKHLHSIAHPVMDQSGEISEVVGTVIDVTERKSAEEALHRSEAYLAEAQRLTHTGSWAYKAGGEGYWSEENFGIWGFDPQQGAPDLETLLQRIHPEDRDRVLEYRVKSVQARQDYELQFRIVLPSGTVKHIQVLAHPVFSGSGELIEVVGTHVDVTERKRAEEERERLRQLEADLAHMNRLTMLGELASSLAHELNQPITAAITSATACLRWLARNPPDMERARAAALRIEKDGSRAAEIIQRLRAFYKTGAPPQRELVDLNEVTGEMLALLHNEATRHSVSLRTELAPQLPQIMADRVQLQQVLMNLMLNGIEAITDGAGELTVRSQSTEDRLLLISVSDTGVGIPSEKLDQIFNAFYTTKPQGTGMGLAISRSIIEAHGGRLWATANLERGATFHFTLPAELRQ